MQLTHAWEEGDLNYHHSAKAVFRIKNVENFFPEFWDHSGKSKHAMLWGSPVSPRVVAGHMVKSQTGAPLGFAWKGYQAGTVREKLRFLGGRRAKDAWRIRRKATD